MPEDRNKQSEGEEGVKSEANARPSNSQRQKWAMRRIS
jgi:hypothetical protein